MPEHPISRRNFLRLLALAGIGAGIAIIQRQTASVGALNFLRWSLRGQIRRLAPPAVVALGYCPTYDQEILPHLRELWRLAEMPEVSGKRLLVKPNLVDVIDGHPTATAAEVVGAVVDLLREKGAAEIFVGDGSAFRRDTQAVAASCGLLEILSARQVPFIDLNYDDPQPVKVQDGWLRLSPQLWLPSHVLEADYVISVPKLKTHHWSGVSLSMKNLIGIVPGARYGWPKNIVHVNSVTASILGIYRLVPPVLAIVDGIIGMEGDGPLFGTAVEHGLLAVGRDPLAVDTICAGLMGFEVDQVSHLSLAAWAGIGQAGRIETRGVPPEQLQRNYQPPPIP
jgi:uncharacterized protein (DUF362 family)